MEAATAFVVHTKALRLSRQYSSYSMRPHGAFTQRAPSDATALLTALPLQGEYSVRLYGGPNRVDLPTLRVLWLDLLPPAALGLLNTTGLCTLDAASPWRPFFTSIDLHTAPLDAIWISPGVTNGGVGGSGGLGGGLGGSGGFGDGLGGSGALTRLQAYPTDRIRPIPNHSWAEVTHCAQGHSWVAAASVEPRPAWKCKPMWLYAAPGSGVSINVGRTLVVTDFIEASALLALAFPGDLSGGPATPATAGADAASRLTHRANTSEVVLWGAGHRTKRRVWARAQPEAAAALERSVASDLSGYDSVQILENWEWYSREPRHEIVMLRLREEDQLDHTTPSLVRCGKRPHLSRCAPDAPALARVAACSERRHDRAMVRRLRARGLQVRTACANGLPPCYRNGTRQAYACAGAHA